MAYTNTAAVKAYLGETGSDDDDLLDALVEAAQAWVDNHTGRTFEASADATRYLDCTAPVVDGRRLWLDRDLCAITSITNGDGVAVASTEYVTQPRNETPYYAIDLLSSKSVYWTFTDDVENAIAIVGRWAYSTTAPNAVAQAAKRLAAYLYRQKDAQVFDVTAMPEAGVIQVPQGMPRDVKLMLAPYVRRR